MQHDLMGELILCLETILTDPRVVYEDPTVMALIDRLVTRRSRCPRCEDTGLWEYRTMPRHYTFSKVMCWVAAHRGAQLAELYGMPERAAAMAPRGPTAAARSASSTAAYNEELGYFTQALDGTSPRRVEPAAADAGHHRCRAIRASSRRCAPTSACWWTTG